MKIKDIYAGLDCMKVFVIGGSGFIGHALINGLKAEGYQLTVLLRRGNKQEDTDRSILHVMGDPMEPGRWQDVMIEHDVVINLAGAAIFRRWSDEVKAEILNSRIVTTRHIVETIRKAQNRNIQFFNASGIGYYGYCGDEVNDEGALHGDTFIARVALDWELEARKAEEAGARVVLCRFGIVLGESGGAMRKISTLAKLYLGGMWGSGKQWFSWIHEKDVVNIFHFLLKNPNIAGAVNFTAPEPVRNMEMVSTFRKVLKKSSITGAIPAVLFELVLGEFSRVFLNGQRVVPRKLIENGFAFQYPTLEEALTDLL